MSYILQWRPLRAVAAVLLWLFWLPGAGAAAPPPARPAAPGPPAAPASTTAAAANPSPAAGSDEKVQELLRAVEEYRGLRFERPVERRSISKAQLEKRFATELHAGAGTSSDEVKAIEVSLKAFGLIPRTFDLAAFLPKLLGSQVAGFYDAKRKELSLVTGTGTLLGAEVAKKVGDDMAERLREGLLVHELTHALQDQHFDLAKLLGDSQMSDADAARKALVEGDATLVMLADMGGLSPDNMGLLSGALDKLLADPKQFMALSQGAPGMAELNSAPPWIRDTLLFSYLHGAAFCASLLEHGGQRLLDHAFSTDPPRSTEQILHPEKWYGQRDDPATIAWPDLAAELPGYAKAAEGQLGELGIRILLAGEANDARRGEAAAGWGGDRFAVYLRQAPAGTAPSSARGRGHRPGAASTALADSPPPLLAWIVEWDTDEAAARFAAATAELGPDWAVERPSARRVVVLRGLPSAAQRTSLAAKLGAAPAEAGANRALDPAAIDPRKKIGAPGSAVAARLGKVRRKVLDQPAVESRLSEDRRTFSIPALGFSLRLPETLAGPQVKDLATPPILLARASPEGTCLLVLAVDLGQPLAIDLIEPFVEAGIREKMPDLTKIEGRFVELGSRRVYDLAFRGSAGGVSVRGQMRAFVQGTQMVTILLLGRNDRWAENESVASEVMAGLTLTPPAAPAAPASPGAPAAPPTPGAPAVAPSSAPPPKPLLPPAEAPPPGC
jgi:hypothetical protein